MLAVPTGMLSLSTSSFSAADELAHLLCLVLRPPLLTYCSAWWLSRKGPRQVKPLETWGSWVTACLQGIVLPQEGELSLLHLVQIQTFFPVPLYQVGGGSLFHQIIP